MSFVKKSTLKRQLKRGLKLSLGHPKFDRANHKKRDHREAMEENLVHAVRSKVS